MGAICLCSDDYKVNETKILGSMYHYDVLSDLIHSCDTNISFNGADNVVGSVSSLELDLSRANIHNFAGQITNWSVIIAVFVNI